jgi:hypothetical protein
MTPYTLLTSPKPAEVDIVQGSEPQKSADTLPGLAGDERATKLVTEMLAGKVSDISPAFDFTSEVGFTYPFLEKTLEVKGQEAVSILESLASQGILEKEFFDRFLLCPQCRSANLRPSTHCPKCGSGNIARGRILEHLVCGYVGLEDEFIAQGRLVCPKCKAELRRVESDYRSLGMMRKCHVCGDIFQIPVIKWRCLKCSSVTAEDKIAEVNIYAYSLNEDKRGWLEFELKPKAQLVEFLRERGYEVTENAVKKGRSSAEHTIDILATRDNGIITHHIAFGIKLAGDTVSLRDVFEFDDKAYDIGIHEKVLLVDPPLDREAELFAGHQGIRVLHLKDLAVALAGATRQPEAAVEPEAFRFSSRSRLLEYLRRQGYQVAANATIRGRSGAEHNIDILATRDDGIVGHRIAIGMEVSDKPIELDKIFDFDDKAYDIGIQHKVFIASPGLSREARQFTERQRIRVFEVEKPEAAG